MSGNSASFSIAEGRGLVRSIRGLGRVRAPESLSGAVLARVGLADSYWEMESPIGRVYVAYGARGITALMRAADPAAFESEYRSRFGRAARRQPRPPAQFARRVEAQLRGERTRLDYDLAALTEFERAVLLKALEIPRGEVRPYAWIAREIGRPAAVRAVGTALARNPIPLLIPCHRVVRSGGEPGNYAFGPEAKLAVLKGEGVQLEALERLSREGVRYVGSDTTHIFCLPTCRHARRISPRHSVPFATAAAAEAGGYRPCLVCRPSVPA